MNTARQTILETVSDDSYGLWEIIADLREAVPEKPPNELRSEASGELLAMQNEGLVEILHLTSLTAPERVIDPEEAKMRLIQEPYWSPPAAGGDEVRVAATDLGVEVYNDSSRGAE